SSEGQAKTPSSQSKNQATPNRNSFDGTWVGTFKGGPSEGDIEFIITITGRGTAISILITKNGGRVDSQGTCDGTTTRWTQAPKLAWTFTPNPDGKTAIATVNWVNPGPFSSKSPPAVFRRVSR